MSSAPRGPCVLPAPRPSLELEAAAAAVTAALPILRDAPASSAGPTAADQQLPPVAAVCGSPAAAAAVAAAVAAALSPPRAGAGAAAATNHHRSACAAAPQLAAQFDPKCRIGWPADEAEDDALLAAAAAKPSSAVHTLTLPPALAAALAAAGAPPAAAAALASLPTAHPITPLTRGGPRAVAAEARRLIRAFGLDDTFYVVDLGNVLRLHTAWRRALPRVQPFYAVKCYPEPGVLKLLASLGTGFDCASKGEVEAVLKLGVPASRVVFAHPCKRPSDIRFARDAGVELTTFDTASELHKVAALHPSFKLVLRIRADDPRARVPLGLKYGADPNEAPQLLALAKSLGLEVVGVAFHVGSACRNLDAFADAIATARRVFDDAAAAGHERMHLLDIGGGFTGAFDHQGNVRFGGIARTINAALARHFPPECGVRVIAEPGRYFAESAATLLTPVYGVRDRPVADARALRAALEEAAARGLPAAEGAGVNGTTADPAANSTALLAEALGEEEEEEEQAGVAAAATTEEAAASEAEAAAARRQAEAEEEALRRRRAAVPSDTTVRKDYWLTDGLYGSFNCILYDGQTPSYRVLRSPTLPRLSSGGSSGAGAVAGGGAAAAASSAAAPTSRPAQPTYASTLWGPTCDSADVIYKDIPLPALRVGDWLQWPRAGAYTIAGACDFNGLEATRPHTFYVVSGSAVDEVVNSGVQSQRGSVAMMEEDHEALDDWEREDAELAAAGAEAGTNEGVETPDVDEEGEPMAA
jgi:diaminopimelate decarboxylase